MAKKEKKITTSKVAGYGFLFALPFLLTNFIVALKIDPFYSLLGAIPFLRSTPILPLFLLLLFPIGAYVALKPTLKTGTLYLWNTLVAAVLMMSFLIISYAIGTEFLNCEILQIPNCD